MEFYSLPYLILILVYILIYFSEVKIKKEGKSNKGIRFLSAFIFILFFGFRGFVGSDWINYENYYAETSLNSWTVLDFEIGFSFVAKLFHDLGFNYNVFVLFITITQTVLWNRFLKKNSNQIALSYIVLISIFPLLIIDLLRNLTSILIAVQAIECVNNNKKVKAILIIIISTFFHATGIFFLIIFLLNLKYCKKWILVLLLFLGLLVYVLQFNFFNNIVNFVGQLLGGRLEYLAGSVTESDKAYGLKWGILEKLFVIVLVLLNYNRIVRHKLVSPIVLNGFFFYCFLLLYFSTSDSIINRFSLLFFWGYTMVLVDLKNLLAKQYITLIVLFICLLKTYVTFNRDIYKYSNILFSEDSYYEREMIREESYKDKE